jgi:hypothetical protein
MVSTYSQALFPKIFLFLPLNMIILQIPIIVHLSALRQVFLLFFSKSIPARILRQITLLVLATETPSTALRAGGDHRDKDKRN